MYGLSPGQSGGEVTYRRRPMLRDVDVGSGVKWDAEQLGLEGLSLIDHIAQVSFDFHRGVRRPRYLR